MTPDRSLKDNALSFLRLVGSGKVRDAYERYVGPSFRHHNAYFRGDRESLLRGMEQNAAKNPGKVIDVKLALQDGDYVAVHSHIRQHAQDRGVSVVHLFRFDDGRIVELWDVGQAIPPESPNQHGMF
ncbi:MAG TPA: nuclear transport factor 2 family protein [Gammaproteobacteria bacterium]|nr:nuclear transport factor 2 family protein [Gammaproteobacteria bacterium]